MSFLSSSAWRKDDPLQEIAEIRRRKPGIDRSAHNAEFPFRDAVYAKRLEDGLIKVISTGLSPMRRSNVHPLMSVVGASPT